MHSPTKARYVYKFALVLTDREIHSGVCTLHIECKFSNCFDPCCINYGGCPLSGSLTECTCKQKSHKQTKSDTLCFSQSTVHFFVLVFAFICGSSVALIASSNTDLSPFWVSAEHSMYFTAPTSLPNFSPCGYVIGT